MRYIGFVRSALPARSSRGMTLIELMIVVVILSILASVAAYSYSAYIRRSRSQEARTMLASIASREAAYRAEFGAYASVGRNSPTTALGVSNAWPAATPGTRASFVGSSIPAEWAQLGFRPSGDVRYRYVVLAGDPSTVPPGEAGFASAPNRDLWFIAEAYGDLDNDGALSTYRLFSGNGNNLTITSELE